MAEGSEALFSGLRGIESSLCVLRRFVLDPCYTECAEIGARFFFQYVHSPAGNVHRRSKIHFVGIDRMKENEDWQARRT